MTIRPIDFNGMLQRTEDVSQVKHQEDAKPLTDQQNIQGTVEQKTDALLHDVANPDQSDGANTDADAREEGRGTYFANRQKREAEKEKAKGDGQVIKKTPSTSFDIKI